MIPILGIDASRYQGEAGMSNARFDALDKAGVRFGIFRSSIGTLVDGSFPVNIERARKRGWVVGAYHFLESHDISAEAQARTFARVVKDAEAMSEALLVVDFEWGRAPDEPLTLRMARTFTSALREQIPGWKQVGLYTAPDYWRRVGNPDVEPTWDYLWLARWLDDERKVWGTDDLPGTAPVAGMGGYGRAELWQYGTFRYMLGGDAKRIDGDAWYGSIEDLAGLGSRPRPPIEERPRYREGWNAEVDAVLMALPGITASTPTGATGPAFPAGVEAARLAAYAAVDALHITEPEA